MSKIIAISGYAGSGKDEAAKALVEERGYQRIAFADVLRDVSYALDPYVRIEGRSYVDYFKAEFVRLQRVVDEFGWDYAKNNFQDVRRTLQRLGTEAGRDILGTNIWVDTAFGRTDEGTNIVVTDCRFENEAAATVSLGGIVVRIERHGVGPRNDHPSEHGLKNWPFDAYVINNGTIEELRASMLSLDDSLDRNAI